MTTPREAQTIHGFFPRARCECGKLGCHYAHRGPLVPDEKLLFCCSECWQERREFYKKRGYPMAIKDGKPTAMPSISAAVLSRDFIPDSA